ncbi:3-dehydroquinate synthase family protein [Macrococcus equi]|uniref:3-dehydroquinate synthase n=1 Tax=Macrococcus equi TaxID=3395462 RepID=UPI0039BE3EAB
MKLTTNYLTNQQVKNYNIIVEASALSLNYDFSHYHQCYALIDQFVYSLHQSKIDTFLKKYQIEKILIPSGEAVKTFDNYMLIVEQLLEKNINRNDCLIAIGGGATGDFTGFVASSILRGISFIQVPTTILAHDAAIGGKTGINSRHGKNLIGAFIRPNQVIYDIDFLDTLNETERLSGFAEIVKHAFLNGKYVINQQDQLINEDLNLLMKDFTSVQDISDKDTIQSWITYGIQTKLNVVEQDELESGVRKFLNFGHTLGHALEFTHRLPHGIAVMHGIMFALVLSNYEDDVIKALYQWIRGMGYPYIEVNDFDYYYDLLRKDKKNEDKFISFVVMQHKMGYLEEVFQIESFNHDTLNKSFERWLKLLRSCYNEN